MGKIGINLSTGSLQKEEMIVGIDLGTTHSLIAILHPESKKPVALREHNQHALVPSVIHFDEQGGIKVGEEARALLASHPERTIFSVKRLMGKSYKDIVDDASFFSYAIHDEDTDSLVKVSIDGKFYSPIELSSLILKELKQRAEHILKTPVNKAVITVPAYFNDTQRQATRDAGKLAGLDVLRIINEPTAASLAYGIGLKEEEKNTAQVVAVYDLGGGTFDVSILRLIHGVFEVLSTHGDTYLGGDDFDKVIVQYWRDMLNIDLIEWNENKSWQQQLRLKAEAAKKHLSFHDEYKTEWLGRELVLTRSLFEEKIQDLVDKTIDCCLNAIKDAGISTKEIDHVLMVGGSTRVPLVKKTVSAFFGITVNDSIHPDEVVALGAAVQADVLAGNNKEVLLLDVTPLSLGIETAGGLMDVLIPRNSKVPTRASRQYTTQVDGQSGMRISVFQGERDLVKDNRKLAEFNLTNIPGMPAGLPKVEVGFIINADGILSVSARELRSGVEQQIEVKPQYGLTDNDVEKMLLESITHAKEDMVLRALTEARTEAEQLLKTTEKFLFNNKENLSQEEIVQTASAMQALQMAMDLQDKNLIQQKTEELNNISRPYAERVMDQAISKAMSGKKIG